MFSYITKLLNRIKGVTELPPEVEQSIDKFYKESRDDDSVIGMLANVHPDIYGNQASDISIILVDDQESVFYLYDSDFAEIKKRFGLDVLSKYKIVKCSGRVAGFVASEYIRNTPDSVVIGILDLTLGTIVKLSNGGTLIYDGVDLALELIELHPRCKIGVCTAHMIEDNNPAIAGLVTKFNTATGHNLLDYCFSKNSDRAEHFYKLLSAVENNEFADCGS